VNELFWVGIAWLAADQKVPQQPADLVNPT